MITETDIALVGAGPLGLEMAVALKGAGLNYVHIESGQVGATMQWWPAGARWFSSPERISIAGVPLVTPMQEKATREEYLAYLRGIVEQFGLTVRTYTRVVDIQQLQDKRFELTLRKSIPGRAGQVMLIGEPGKLIAKKLILSTGGTEQANLLGVAGEELPHVSHYFHDPHTYFQRELMIVGGRNSAVETALRCHRAGARVSMSYRRDVIDSTDIKYWLYPEFSSLVKSGKITAHYGTAVSHISPTHVALRPTGEQSGIETFIPADFVLLMTGYVADMSLAKMAGVSLTSDGGCPVFDAKTMESNIPGVYVAGTAIAGTQRRYKVFLENCHVHVDRIVGHMTGSLREVAGVAFERPES